MRLLSSLIKVDMHLPKLRGLITTVYIFASRIPRLSLFFFRNSQRRQREREDFTLPPDYEFIFYFPSDNTFMRLKHDAKYWKPEHTNTMKIALVQGQEVHFKMLASGIFVYKGMALHLELVEKYLEQEIASGFEMSKLNISLALKNALISLDAQDDSDVFNDDCSSDPEDNEHVSVKKPKKSNKRQLPLFPRNCRS